MESGKPGGERERRSRSTGATWPASAGWKILIPGHAQWSWGQRERGLFLFGSFAAALGVGAFAWGSLAGLLMLGFAFGAHVVSVLDVVRQTAFPSYARGMALVSTSGGLAAGVYVPMLGMATLLAWPAVPDAGGRDGFLINRRAYAGVAAPGRGDWVLFRPTPWGAVRVGRVAAAAGEAVEWSSNRLRIDGSPPWLALPIRPGAAAAELDFEVPEGYALVLTEAPEAGGGSPSGALLVPRGQIAGRAWARLYPVGKRELLR